MLARITPGPLSGTVDAIASKSMAHRLIIAAALSDDETHVVCNTTCADIDATIGCMTALGAGVERSPDGYLIHPLPRRDDGGIRADETTIAQLDCGESGSTLRFMLPVACALGRRARLGGSETLAHRPVTQLIGELVAGGCDIQGVGGLPLETAGRLRAGRFELPGDVSSQYISGLLLACAALERGSTVLVRGRIESRPYVNLTMQALKMFGVEVDVERLAAKEDAEEHTLFTVPAASYTSPGEVVVEGDWSNAAFWFCAGAMGPKAVGVEGLSLSSAQGDRNVLAALSRFGARITRSTHAASIEPDRLCGFTMCAQDIPDLVPAIAAVASVAAGTTVITGCGRLRIKESDRLRTTTEVLGSLGANITIQDEALVVQGRPSLSGGRVSAHGDHRIAMMAAIAATRSDAVVDICGAEVVSKSYPMFFEHYQALGGQAELLEE